MKGGYCSTYIWGCGGRGHRLCTAKIMTGNNPRMVSSNKMFLVSGMPGWGGGVVRERVKTRTYSGRGAVFPGRMEGPQLAWAPLTGVVFAPGRSPWLPSLAKAGC